MSGSAPLKVFLVCTGVGVLNRGIETFASECFQGLRDCTEFDLSLHKGAGPETPPRERRLWCLPRTGVPARGLGVCIRRNGYVVEQLSSLLPLIWRIRRERPDIIFLSEGNLRRRLFQLRRFIGVPFRLLFSNGGPVKPPFPDADHVQQLTPFHRDQALSAGEPPEKHSLVPYGIHVPAGPPDALPAADRAALRGRLGLPVDKTIVLSVGWISRAHKRTDYVVEEIAALPLPRPHLVLLGLIDTASKAIIELANRLLGPEGVTVRSVPYEEVGDYYRAADVFTLGSLQEGFGRVYLEALMHGLPCIVNDHPIMRYVLDNEGTFSDFSRPRGLTEPLAHMMPSIEALSKGDLRSRRRESVRTRFDWKALAPAYAEMFRRSLLPVTSSLTH